MKPKKINIKHLKEISDKLDKREKELDEKERLLNKKIEWFDSITKNYKIAAPLKH